MQCHLTCSSLKALLAATAAMCVLTFLPARAAAQADPTEFKTQSISAYAAYLHDNADDYPEVNNGVAFGIDVTRHIKFPVHPSLEGRANLASGKLVNEKSYLVGLKGEYRIRRYHPYVDFLVGFGTIHYNYNLQGGILGDNSTVYAPGAGVDVDLVRGFSVKVDFEHQYWNTGHTSATEFQPNLLSLGVKYVVPFRPFHRQGEPHY